MSHHSLTVPKEASVVDETVDETKGLPVGRERHSGTNTANFDEGAG